MEVDLEQLTNSLIRDYVGYEGGNLLILLDEPSMEIGRFVNRSALFTRTEAHKVIRVLDVDDFRKGKALEEIPQEMMDAAAKDPVCGKSNTLLYFFSGMQGEPWRNLILHAEKYGKVGGMPYCTIDVLRAGYHPENNSDFVDELFDFIQKEKEVRVTCDRGTDIAVTMNHDTYNLVKSDGKLVENKFGNPIPAEVFAHPETAEGRFVFSGTFGPLLRQEKFRGKYAELRDALDKSPVTWDIKKGLITDVNCENDEIRDFVRKHVFEMDEKGNGNRIGEFGLPANLYVLKRDLTGHLLIDEKGRVHLANGFGYNQRTGCKYESAVHGDGLLANATLEALSSGKVFMRNNEYSSEIFRSLRG